VSLKTQTLLASELSLAETLGVDPDPTHRKRLKALEIASAQIRGITRQHFDLVTADQIDLRGSWADEIRLPQRPVLDVSEIQVRWQGSQVFDVLSSSAYTWDRAGRLRGVCSIWGGPGGTVRPTYDHGFAEIPEDIEAVCLAMARRWLQNPGAVASETLVDYSVTYGPIGLTEDEAKTLEDYRRWP